MNRSPKFHQSPRVDELTEIEARTIEAIARGENPCARVGEEHPDAVGSRRRAVSALERKGFATRGPAYLARKGVPSNFPEDVKATAPTLTEKGRTFMAGRS